MICDDGDDISKRLSSWFGSDFATFDIEPPYRLVLPKLPPLGFCDDMSPDVKLANGEGFEGGGGADGVAENCNPPKSSTNPPRPEPEDDC